MATTRKTPATSTINLFKYTIDLYKKNNDGSLPKDWKELVESGVLSNRMIEDAEKYLDFENRYCFPDPPIALKNRNSEIRVIIMANQSGGEGDYQSLDEKGNPLQVAGRYLIFETSEGKIGSGRFTEKRLEKMFIDSGINLLDHTFDAPPPPKRTKQPNPNETHRLVLRGPEDFGKSGENPGHHRNRPEEINWLPWICGGFVLMTILIWLILRNQLNR